MADRIRVTQDDGFTTGRVFSRAFGTIAANPLAALGIAFLFNALPSEAYEYASDRLVTTSPVEVLALAKAFVLMASGTFFAALANGGFVRLAVAHDAGRRPSFVEALRAGGQSLLPLIAVGLIIGVGTTIGLILLIVPGIFLSLMWAVAGAVLVDEQCGPIAALGRSRTLTEGVWGAIFGIGIVTGLAAALFLYVTLRLAGDLTGSAADTIKLVQPSILYLSIELLVTTIAAAVSAAVYTSLYVELRNWKHGTPEDALAEVFA